MIILGVMLLITGIILFLIFWQLQKSSFNILEKDEDEEFFLLILGIARAIKIPAVILIIMGIIIVIIGLV